MLTGLQSKSIFDWNFLHFRSLGFNFDRSGWQQNPCTQHTVINEMKRIESSWLLINCFESKKSWESSYSDPGADIFECNAWMNKTVMCFIHPHLFFTPFDQPDKVKILFAFSCANMFERNWICGAQMNSSNSQRKCTHTDIREKNKTNLHQNSSVSELWVLNENISEHVA